MKGYGSFCPVAKASEVLSERWTLLMVRELLLGSRHFNDFRRGLPHMSPTLLSKRLQSLEEAGILAKWPQIDRQHPRRPAVQTVPSGVQPQNQYSRASLSYFGPA